MLRDKLVTELSEDPSIQRGLGQRNPPRRESFNHKMPRPGFPLARTLIGILDSEEPSVLNHAGREQQLAANWASDAIRPQRVRCS